MRSLPRTSSARWTVYAVALRSQRDGHVVLARSTAFPGLGRSYREDDGSAFYEAVAHVM